ncbi:MAG: hypothetical protein H7A25_09105 [Leptospiraceae bacterium]|nr:hypothetical protein [Leptospiraceae bacterium]MCP5500048.1 hypothetical protein [Leptospiraceae bacterium]
MKYLLSHYSLILFLTAFLQSCFTTVGFHRKGVLEKINFGKPEILQVCFLTEEGITDEDIKDLQQAWQEELKLYNIELKISGVRRFERLSFWGGGVLGKLPGLTKVDETCHRYIYLVGRTYGDLAFEVFTLGIFAISGLKFETYGAVEGYTQTRGYIKAKYSSLLQLLFTSPESTLVHEGYHLLGCGHQLFLDDCYIKIKRAKLLRKNVESKSSFLPVITVDEQIILSPEDANY